METLEQVQKNNPEVKFYDYAHLVVFCGKCGSKYILEENVPKNKGIQILLPPTSTSEIRLVCKDCKNEMGLFYIESNKKDEENESIKALSEGETNESVQENSATEVAAV